MSRRLTVVLLLAVVLVGIVVYRFWRVDDAPLQVNDPNQARPKGPDEVLVGGVARPRSDIRQPNKDDHPEPKTDKGYGIAPTVPPDLNPQVESVVEAIREKNHPERLSVLIPPKPFDRDAYQQDPKTYLNTVEPGRVFQPAQPGPDVTRIKAISPRLQRVLQGEAVYLEVTGVPEMPVTFTTFDMGEFSNRLTSITIQTDKDGRARVEFTATPGTINDIHILAASPTTSGQVKYVVNVRLPEPVEG